MIYLKHDFLSNFTNALRYGDDDFLIDLFSDSLSDVINNYPDKVIEVVNMSGLKAGPKLSDESLVAIICANMPKNKSLRKGLAFVIAEANDIPKGNGFKTSVDTISLGVDAVASRMADKVQLVPQVRESVIRAVEIKSGASGDERQRMIRQEHQNPFPLIIAIGITAYVLYWAYNRYIVASNG